MQGELYFIGLGLSSEYDLSLRALEILKKVDKVFLEAYTSLMPELNIKNLEKLIGKKINIVTRKDLEEEDARVILDEALHKKVALLVPGDPFVATTHIAICINAKKRGIKVNVIHGPSIISAIYGATGLQCYKFGKIVTIVYPEPQYSYFPETPYEVLYDNLMRGLHTLFLLDLKVEKGKCMSIKEAIEILLELEKRKKKNIVKSDTLAVGLARLGSRSQKIKAGTLIELKNYDFGPPPHSLIIPAKLHPLEAEALILLADADEKIVKRYLK